MTPLPPLTCGAVCGRPPRVGSLAAATGARRAEVNRARRAEKLCEAEHDAAHENYDR